MKAFYLETENSEYLLCICNTINCVVHSPVRDGIFLEKMEIFGFKVPLGTKYLLSNTNHQRLNPQKNNFVPKGTFCGLLFIFSINISCLKAFQKIHNNLIYKYLQNLLSFQI